MENLHHHNSSSSPYESKEDHYSSHPIPNWSSFSNSSTTTSSSPFQFFNFPNFNEDKTTTSASKSHSQAEKRRRDRINAQLSTLRKLIPKSDKMDKAALLGSVIEHVKDLKRKAIEIGKSLTIPTEIDEIIIDNQESYIRASLCCDDRPELFSELIQVLNALRLTAVRADVASIGGRIKSVLILSSNKENQSDNSVINSLRQSLKVVLTKIASQSMATNCRVRSKRQRFFLPSQYSNNSDHQHHNNQ